VNAANVALLSTGLFFSGSPSALAIIHPMQHAKQSMKASKQRKKNPKNKKIAIMTNHPKFSGLY